MSGRRIYLNIRHKLSRVLNPALCQICGVTVKQGAFYCAHCWAGFEPVPNACKLCGLPNPAAGSVCAVCLLHPPPWQRMQAPLIYAGNTRNEIHRLKYQKNTEVAKALLDNLQDQFVTDQNRVLIPVPLHKTRLLERGFNQSEEIAQRLSEQLQLPVDRHCLSRIRPTRPQAGLSPSKRRTNLLRAFEYTAQHRYQSVVIIDDVITSGSTVTEICRLLRRNGVQEIEVWSLARALKNNQTL